MFKINCEKGCQTPEPELAMFGRGQVIIRLENGVYVAGCESRTDSNIACY